MDKATDEEAKVTADRMARLLEAFINRSLSPLAIKALGPLNKVIEWHLTLMEKAAYLMPMLISDPLIIMKRSQQHQH